MSSLLYPSVIDETTLSPRLSATIYLPIGIEGEAAAAGTATVATLYAVSRVDEAATLFGTTSPLYALIKEILDRGAGPVVAGASAKAASPTLVQRQAVWEKMESDENIRIRLTDSAIQADLVELANSAEFADVIDNKQFSICGMPAATPQATLTTAAAAIGSDRGVLIAPGIYDRNGSLKSGSYAAAIVAAEVAKNADPANDLDLHVIPLTGGIEKGADGLPVFRRKVVAGVEVNDFQALLEDGVSPLQNARIPGGGVEITHLRMTDITSGGGATWDSLMTRIIVDQIFLDVKNYIYEGRYFQLGNTQQTRLRIKSGVEALLAERSDWIERVDQPDGTLGYNVSVTQNGSNPREVIIGYEGTVVRGISTVKVSANLTILV